MYTMQGVAGLLDRGRKMDFLVSVILGFLLNHMSGVTSLLSRRTFALAVLGPCVTYVLFMIGIYAFEVELSHFETIRIGVLLVGLAGGIALGLVLEDIAQQGKGD